MPQPPSPRAVARVPVGRIAGATVLAVFGVLWALLLAFASGMQTVPEMSLGYALATLPLPLAALGLIAWVATRVRRGAAPRSSLWWSLPALAGAAFALFIGGASYFSMP